MGEETQWPFTTEPYTVDSDAFEVVPAELTVREVEGGVVVALIAPENGYRLIDLEGSSVGDNPPVGALSYTLQMDGEPDLEGTFDQTLDGLPFLPLDPATLAGVALTVEDEAGNGGQWASMK